MTTKSVREKLHLVRHVFSFALLGIVVAGTMFGWADIDPRPWGVAIGGRWRYCNEVFAHPMTWIDGNWIDIFSFGLALLYAFAKALKRRPVRFVSKAMVSDLANGTSLFPLFLLGMTIVSSRLLRELLRANKLILSVAGICALIALLEDDFI